jgi:hypothetical protein
MTNEDDDAVLSQVLLPEIVVDWLLEPERVRRFGTDPVMWEILSEAVNR